MAEQEVPLNFAGFALIGEMTKEELVDEFLAYQRECMEEMNEDTLKKLVIQKRVHTYTKRLTAEAKMDEEQNPFSWFS
jgi:predicted ABC-type transport system involved in lysophospholipase L1 biosynthesis ATPase subunit